MVNVFFLVIGLKMTNKIQPFLGPQSQSLGDRPTYNQLSHAVLLLNVDFVIVFGMSPNLLTGVLTTNF